MLSSHADARFAAIAAEMPPNSAEGSAPSSFGRALIRVLPSEVQLSIDCVAQLESSKRSAAPEQRAVTALDAYQTEKAHVHGTLVSYLHSGSQSHSMHKASTRESHRGASETALSDSGSAEGQVSRSSEPSPASITGSTGRQQSSVVTEQQRQERSTALGMPDSQNIACRTELNNAVNMEQNLGSSTKMLSRREEAMALLESRHHSTSPG